MMMERARAGAIEEVLAAPGAWEERFAVCLPDIERASLSLFSAFVPQLLTLLSYLQRSLTT